jgi:dihydrofolate synthase/folylpolyglutamate synthase
LRSRHFRINDVRLGLDGPHQIRNAQTALAALDTLRGRFPDQVRNVTSATVVRGFRAVVRNSGILGRLQRWGRNGSVFLDVAHNPDAVAALVEALRELRLNRVIVVFGVMADKDYEKMIIGLSAVAVMFVTVAPAQERALPERKLRQHIAAAGYAVRKGGNVGAGLRVAMTIAGNRGKVLITGSHYVVGDALQKLGYS